MAKRDAAVEDIAEVAQDPRDQEIAALKAQLAAAQAAAAGGPSGPIDEYPKTKYQQVEANKDHPNGYRVVRVNDPAEEGRLGPEWKDSPADL